MQASSIANKRSPDNWLQSLDVKAKMLICLLASTLTVCFSSLYAQLVLFAFSFVYLLSLRKWKIMIVSYVAVALIMAISVGMLLLLSNFIPALLKGAGLKNLGIPFLRMLVSLNVILPLAFSTNIQSILHSLQQMNLPFCIYLPAAVIIRFIPTFANDIKQVWESLKIRGWKLNPWTATIHPIMTTRLLFTPILFRALKTSDELGIAAELKGLSSRNAKTPKMKKGWTKTEWIVLGVCVFVAALALTGQMLTPVELKGGLH